MMKHTLSIVLWLTGMTLVAQPVFEITFQESASISHLENLGEIYYSMDVVNKQCLIYDMNHKLLKSIPLPVRENYYLTDLQFVSETLFNSDNLVEFVYTYSKYVPTDLSYYYTFETKVINENGSVLLTLDNVGFTDVFQTAGYGRKFLAYEYNYALTPYRTYTHVYSLPDGTNKSESYLSSSIDPGNAYPNPAGNLVTIPVFLPDGFDSGRLEIIDLNGRIVSSYPLSEADEHMVIPTGQLAPGTYIYQVHSGNWKSSSKKIVVR